jgi:hypothetical protein
LRLLTEHLANGDFYWPAGGTGDRSAQGLLLADAASGSRAGPAKRRQTGFEHRGSESVGVRASRCVAIWSKWLKTNSFDEFSRIDVIKGQKSKRRAMTAVAPRRTVINEVLRDCPIGAWVGVDDLSRFMEATGRTFEVTNDPWSLYICEPQHGNLGHDGYHDWSILQFRYLLCILFEYAAALGVVDVAYIEPAGVRDDYRGMWGTDDLEYLSRYDGLTYFRITLLGAYCLGLNEEYVPPPVVPSVKLAVLPSLQVNVTDGQLSMDETLTLATWAEELKGSRWRLDHQKAVGAIEKGLDIEELRVFLVAREDQPLSETVESFIKAAGQQGKALKVLGTALLIDCENEKIASMVADAKETAGLCLRAGERQLVVRFEHEEKFRSLVRKLGFGVTV